MISLPNPDQEDTVKKIIIKSCILKEEHCSDFTARQWRDEIKQYFPIFSQDLFPPTLSNPTPVTVHTVPQLNILV